MPFDFEPLSIADVMVVRSTRHRDDRGWLMELFRGGEFAEHLGVSFVQANLSRSRHRVLRGLHFQLQPSAQGKLVHVVSGSVFDVAVDLRSTSPTRGQWVGRALTGASEEMLWIPPGFAHGYVAVSAEGACVAYQMTNEYEPALERGVAWDDPDLAIAWPVSDPIVSEKDRRLPRLAELDDVGPA